MASAGGPPRSVFPSAPPFLSQLPPGARTRPSKLADKYGVYGGPPPQLDLRKEMFEGFTSRELVDLDVWTTRELKAGDLSNPIMDLLHRDRWEKGPDVKTERENLPSLRRNNVGKGDWTAANADIYAELEPVLMIASRILMSIHLVPWFDALLLGDIRKVAKDRLPQRFKQEDNICTFHPRPFSRESAKERFEETKQRRGAIFSTLIQEYSFTLGFMNGVDPPHVGVKAGKEDGLTTHTDENCIVVLLNTGLIEPLLLYRRDLTDCERMGHHWMAAITLVHEVMHAIQLVRVDKDQANGVRQWNADAEEPYFEDEQIPEVGWSMENAVWLRRKLLAGCPILSLNTLRPYTIKVPVKASVYERVQQTGFWEVLVRARGFKVLQGEFPKQASFVQFKNFRTENDDLSAFDLLPSTPLIKTIHSTTELDYLKGLIVSEVQAYTVAKDIFQSSTSEQEFWDNSQAMEKHIVWFRRITNNQPMEAREAMTVLQFMPPSIKNHLDMVSALLLLEKRFGAVYKDRRGNLLRWNRGTRRFMSFLRSRFQEEAEIFNAVERELLNIEYARMILAEPNNTPKGLGVQFEEFQALVKAQEFFDQGKFAQCYAQCNKYYNFQSSLVANAACSLLIAQLRDIVEYQPRVNALQTGQRILEVLRNGDMMSSCQPGWDTILDQWIALSARVGGQMITESQQNVQE
ncbi:hypothetical protein V8E51_014804 [Hyaloscypha variabilis]